MILPDKKDAAHKAWLYRLLMAIYDEPFLGNALYFKGGTCAAMLGFLDRFSIDLDFDFVKTKEEMDKTRGMLEKIFEKLGLTIKDKSKNTIQYFLRYPANKNLRNTLKIDCTFPPPKANIYKPMQFKEIDRVIISQSIETMFANKLVALIDRYEKNGSIAGRDLYDIHHFFLNSYHYNAEVIIERRNKNLKMFFDEIIDFIDNYVTKTIITQDLNYLLPPDKFQLIRKILRRECLMFLRDERAWIGEN
ncbi:MAG: nucleotidyl transferase AbiEii/AbiGii toxin family protein [bacterium]